MTHNEAFNIIWWSCKAQECVASQNIAGVHLWYNRIQKMKWSMERVELSVHFQPKLIGRHFNTHMDLGPKHSEESQPGVFWRKSLKICQVGCDFILTESGCNLIAIYKTKWSTNKQQAKSAVENTWQKTKEEMLLWVLVPDFGQPLPSNDLVII